MHKPAPTPPKTFLTLGWRVTPNYHPSYWMKGDALTGHQPDEQLVRVPSELMASHTVIVAKSGSGKSFFLGRLIEELMLHTKARCLVLDSNADFRNVDQVEDPKLWLSASYDPLKGMGKLPTELSRKHFTDQWSKVSVKVLTGDSDKGLPFEEFKIWWPSLSPEFLAENLDPIESSKLRQCHEFFSLIVSLYRMKERITSQRLTREGQPTTGQERHFLDYINSAEQMLSNRQRSDFSLQEALMKEFRDLIVSEPGARLNTPSQKRDEKGRMAFATQRVIERRIRQAVQASKYVSDEIVRFYFSRAHEYQARGILADEPLPYSNEARLTVVDLPTLGDQDTLLAVHAILAIEWEKAGASRSSAFESPADTDERVPTFVVVDEAHNLMPAKTNSRLKARIRDQFRTIAAEGRKYGLFLILVSQRPDKLDPFVISECDNKAVMQLDSDVVLRYTQQSLGLDGNGLLPKSLNFGTGRIIIAGRWSPEPQIFYCAARRTREGGRNLRASFWASA